MKVPYHNDTDKFVHVGPVTIAPGHTRDVDETHLHGFKAEQPAAAHVPADPLAELLKGNVKDVVAALGAMSTSDVERIGELEQLGQNRKGILSAVAELLLNRASDEMLAKIAAMDDAALAAALAEAGTDINVNPDYLAALEAEAAKRNPGSAA